MLQYIPQISSELKTPEFRAFMVECASDYIDLVQYSHKGNISLSLSCLALEILLKSFNAKVAGNEGKINETYEPNEIVRSLKGKKGHDLIELMEILDDDYKNYLFSKDDISILTEHRDFFVGARYGYENNAPKAYTDAIVKLAGETLCKVVYLYKLRGSTDPFILGFDVNEFYFTRIQRVLFVKKNE